MGNHAAHACASPGAGSLEAAASTGCPAPLSAEGDLSSPEKQRADPGTGPGKTQKTPGAFYRVRT